VSGPRLADVDLSLRIDDRDEYAERLLHAQIRLLYLQHEIRAQGRRAILAFEGWDAAGKGGAIRRVTGRLDPRSLRVHAIGAPDAEDRGRHYLRRFWLRLPRPGRLVIFDRTWYGRVLVERIEGLCDEAAWQRAYDEIKAFERQLVDDGIALVKFFLHISSDEQLARFEERRDDPFKAWKLTDDDWRNRANRDAYVEATDEALARTHTAWAPWTVVAANQKKYARVAVAEAAVRQLSSSLGIETEHLPAGWRLDG